MTLKRLVNQKIVEEILGVCRQGKWKVLVLDQLGLRIISACCELNEIIAHGIALIEDITKKREPLPSLEAVYLISPEKSLTLLQADFEQLTPLYAAAHVFFTSTCSDALFGELRNSPCARYIRTLKEISAAFVPYESQVFSLDCSADTFSALFSSTKKALEECAEQLATVCATLGEFPRICFRTDDDGLNIRFATLVQQRLDAFKAMDGTLREGHSQLLIVDRGFDCITPIIHDLTFQSMIFDLMPVDNDVWKYADPKTGKEKELLFNESAELWSEFRHAHIAVVNQQLPIRVKQFKEENAIMEGKMGGEKADMRTLSEIVKKLPRYQKESGKYVSFFKVAEDCMKRYSTYVKKMCQVEQDIAMGCDASGEVLQEAAIRKKVFPLFLDQNLEMQDKMRIILLYIISNNGITEENLQKLVQHAHIPEEEKAIITNLKKLGIDMDPTKRTVAYPRKDRLTDETYDTARWNPVVLDVIEDAIANKLNTRHFNYLTDDKPKLSAPMPKSLRFGARDPKVVASNGTGKNSRLIVFFLGGVTYSEMRCAYEVTRSRNSACEVIIGSTQIMTPATFLNNLRQLS